MAQARPINPLPTMAIRPLISRWSRPRWPWLRWS